MCFTSDARNTIYFETALKLFATKRSSDSSKIIPNWQKSEKDYAFAFSPLLGAMPILFPFVGCKLPILNVGLLKISVLLTSAVLISDIASYFTSWGLFHRTVTKTFSVPSDSLLRIWQDKSSDALVGRRDVEIVTTQLRTEWVW